MTGLVKNVDKNKIRKRCVGIAFTPKKELDGII